MMTIAMSCSGGDGGGGGGGGGGEEGERRKAPYLPYGASPVGVHNRTQPCTLCSSPPCADAVQLIDAEYHSASQQTKHTLPPPPL